MSNHGMSTSVGQCQQTPITVSPLSQYQAELVKVFAALIMEAQTNID